MNTISTLEVIETGDVIEFEIDDTAYTALVLLAGEALILDLCDGSMPIVARIEELGSVRRFAPDASDYLSLAA
jgi:hypothetical protein